MTSAALRSDTAVFTQSLKKFEGNIDASVSSRCTLLQSVSYAVDRAATARGNRLADLQHSITLAD